MAQVFYPSLYQINTRVWLTELSQKLGRAATLDDVPDAELDRLAELGFEWVWLLSVWQTGLAGQQVSRSNAGWRVEFQATLPDLQEEDIAGSGFAITAYTVSETLGGKAALARLRKRLAKRELKLMLDFVPNHMALDHPWIEDHPEYFVSGDGGVVSAGAAELYPGQTAKGRLDPGSWTGSIFFRLAGYSAARLQQPRHSGCDDRGAREDRQPVRRPAL